MFDGKSGRRACRLVAVVGAIVLAFAGALPGRAHGQALNPTWTQQANTPPPPTGPESRGWHQIAYDEINQKTVVFGGSGSTYYNDIWWYDAQLDFWSQIEPFVNCDGIVDFVPPAKRDEHVFVYDSANHLYWMFGGSGFGCIGIERTTRAGTTSVQIVDPFLPGNTTDFYKDWTVKALYTANAGGSQAYVQAYNPVTKTLTLATPLSGLGPGMPYRVYPQRGGGTWYYSPVSRTWSSLSGPHWGYTGPSPVSRLSPGFAYSPVDRAILMFGGVGGGGPRTDTWVLDVVAKAWVQMLPANAPGSPPALRQLENSMVYDRVHDVFVLFGGLLGTTETADTWVYRLSTNTWTKRTPAVSPSARQQHQMTFDAANGVTVLYGGRRGSEIFQDLWTYDYGANTWTLLSASNPPGPARLASIVYDSELQQSVLYKGRTVFTLKLGDQPPPPPPPSQEIVVDNARAGVSDAARTFTGTWCTSEATGQLGPDSLYSCQGGAHSYRWRPTIPATGQFDVYVRWTQHVNRSGAVPIAVTHAGGTTSRAFDERTGGGVWTLHGRYTFNAGTAGFVQVTDSAGQAAADGVRLVPVSP